MRVEAEHYGFELPEESAAEIVASIDDETARDSILDAIEAAGESEAVRLPLGLADTLLNALSEWERKGEDEAAAQDAEWDAIEAGAAQIIEEVERGGE